jgi:hypothetical protein
MENDARGAGRTVHVSETRNAYRIMIVHLTGKDNLRKLEVGGCEDLDSKKSE